MLALGIKEAEGARVMIIAKPVGRGNWHQIVVAVEGPRAQPMLVKAGDRFELAGVIWRIVKVVA